MSEMNISQMFGIRVPTIRSYTSEIPMVNPELVMGMEIETENCDHTQDWYQDRLSGLNWTVATDGSLRGVAYEFISRPMAVKHLAASVRDFFKVTGFTDENYTSRTSIHVHVNCLNLGVDHLSSLGLLYSVFEESLFGFIGNDRDTNNFCIPWNQCRFNKKLILNLKDHITMVPSGWQKYTALNLVPLQTQGTVEFRHMHGSSNLVKIHQWLNIIASLFQYATTHSFKDVYETIRNLNTVSNYEQFFHQVFGQHLQYSEEIHLQLEAGVISAKLALVSYDPDAKPKEKKASPSVFQDLSRTPRQAADVDVTAETPPRQRRVNVAETLRRMAEERIPPNTWEVPEWTHRVVSPTPENPSQGGSISERRGRDNGLYRQRVGPNSLRELLRREAVFAERGIPQDQWDGLLNTEGRTF